MSYSQIVPSVLVPVSAVLHPGSKYSNWTGCLVNGLYAIGSGQKNSGDCAEVCSIHLLADGYRIYTRYLVRETAVPCFGYLVICNSDRFDSARCISRFWQGDLHPVSFVFTMSKTQCAAKDLKGNPSLWILLCEEVLSSKLGVRLNRSGRTLRCLLLLC